jgi:hypothetical protein
LRGFGRSFQRRFTMRLNFVKFVDEQSARLGGVVKATQMKED